MASRSIPSSLHAFPGFHEDCMRVLQGFVRFYEEGFIIKGGLQKSIEGHTFVIGICKGQNFMSLACCKRLL